MNDKYLEELNYNEPELRPFDLEAAMRGEPLVTRDGRRVKFVAHVPETKKHNVVVVIEGEGGCRVDMFMSNGRFYANNREDSEHDLFMAPKPKRTVWVNFHEEKQLGFWYTSEDLAKSNAGSQAVAVAVPVQIDVW